MNFSPEITHESQTIPGVKFTTRRLGPVKRAGIELKLAKERAEEREILQRYREPDTKLKQLMIAAGVDENGIPLVAKDSTLITPEMIQIRQQIDTADAEYRVHTTAKIKPVWIKEGLVSVEGEPLGGAVVTAESLGESGPDELFEEIYQVIHDGAYIDPDTSKNSQRSSTSTEAAGPETNSTIVNSVESVDITPAEAVTATSSTT